MRSSEGIDTSHLDNQTTNEISNFLPRNATRSAVITHNIAMALEMVPADHRAKSRAAQRCIGLLRPLLASIIYVLVMFTSFTLPFARVSYLMHTVSLSDKSNITATPIHTERISVDLMLYGVCSSNPQIQDIDEKKEVLMKAGNRVDAAHNEVTSYKYKNRLQLILNTRLIGLHRLLCGEDDGVGGIDLQLATWTAAGLIAATLLILACTLAIISIVIHLISALQRARTGDSQGRYRANGFVGLFSEATSWIALLASILYLTFTWAERKSSNSSLGSGYILLLVITIAIHSTFMGLTQLFFSKAKSTFGAALHHDRCQTEKEETSSLPSIMMNNADLVLMSDTTESNPSKQEPANI